jgi:hypothetical protein
VHVAKKGIACNQVLTVTGLFTGCTLDSSTRISFICKVPQVLLTFVSLLALSTALSPHSNSKNTEDTTRNDPYVFAQQLQLILCQIVDALDLLNPKVQVYTHISEQTQKTAAAANDAGRQVRVEQDI